MQLAIFAAKQPEDRTWLEKMTEWNRAHPVEWNYVERSNFSYDCLQAHVVDRVPSNKRNHVSGASEQKHYA